MWRPPTPRRPSEQRRLESELISGLFAALILQLCSDAIPERPARELPSPKTEMATGARIL